MAGRLEGKVAIVTGAGGGIGRAEALALAAEGASILVNDLGTRTGADADAVVAEIAAAGGRAIADRTSATWDGATGIVARTIDAFGRVDILINNATSGGRPKNLWEVTEAEWDLVQSVNLKGYFALIRAVTPYLAQQKSGVIINTSSGAGFGFPGSVAYAAAKEGVIGLTRSVALELGRFGIRCNAIRPLALATSFGEFAQLAAPFLRLIGITTAKKSGMDESDRASPESHPPAKVAAFVAWLCTDAASNINGRSFHTRGDVVALFSEPVHERRIRREGGWTLDALDEEAPRDLTFGLADDYRLDDHPDLQVFEPASV